MGKKKLVLNEKERALSQIPIKNAWQSRTYPMKKACTKQKRALSQFPLKIYIHGR